MRSDRFPADSHLDLWSEATAEKLLDGPCALRLIRDGLQLFLGCHTKLGSGCMNG
jgi:hypothetical protein